MATTAGDGIGIKSVDRGLSDGVWAVGDEVAGRILGVTYFGIDRKFLGTGLTFVVPDVESVWLLRSGVAGDFGEIRSQIATATVLENVFGWVAVVIGVVGFESGLDLKEIGLTTSIVTLEDLGHGIYPDENGEAENDENGGGD